MTHEYKDKPVTILTTSGSQSRILLIGAEEYEAFWVSSDRVKEVLSPEEKFQKKLQASLTVIESSPAAYQVAGFIASHPSKFNISHPPDQRDLAIEAIMKYGIDITDETLTESSDRTLGWSCSVVTDDYGIADELLQQTGVHSTQYFDTDKLSIQAREFVLGFLGGTLGFKLGEVQDVTHIRTRIPSRYLPDFDLGVYAKTF